MIREAYRHLPGIGKERAARIQAAGVGDWRELAQQPGALVGMSQNHWQYVVSAIAACEFALAENDLHYLIQALAPRDQWRILADYFDAASYFDIETNGLDYDSYTTVIVCYHRGEFHRFVRHENLEEFLDLLEDVDLLVSFNGVSFDVPRVEQEFHIPGLPCPHLDLRWVSYHAGLSGGLKNIERRLGILRPPDLAFVDGAEAVSLWERWDEGGDPRARQLLERYCCADVAALVMVAAELLRRQDCPVVSPPHRELWEQINGIEPPADDGREKGRPDAPAGSPVDDESRSTLEERLRRMLRQRR